MKIRRRAPIAPVEVDTVRYQVNLPDSSPANILEEIVWHKEKEVQRMRESVPLKQLQMQVKQAEPVRDFLGALKSSPNQPALIAEIKKASPSKGIIKQDFDPVSIAKDYQAAGAACLSVLTDSKFFAGSFDNLALVRRVVDLPLLCKEFIIYPYQMYLARNQGADAVLLIAAILSNQELQYFLRILEKLQMTALIEVHTLEEMDRVLELEGVQLIGINNRNLENFTVDLQNTCNILQERGEKLEKRNILVVSESGIFNSSDLKTLSNSGARAVLIGESLVKQEDPREAIFNLYGKI
jgi:indole-3-glycerol phosphate synthase